MKNIRFILFSFCVLIYTSAQAQYFSDTIYFNQIGESINNPDSNGYFRVISNDTSGQIQFFVHDYYANGQLKMTGTYRSINPDNKNGIFNYYYPGGELLKTCKYINNKLTGTYREWYENGRLKQESYYSGNKLSGIIKTWSPDGKLLRVAEYENGLKNGKFVSYYPNGTPVRVEKYKDDKLLKAKCYTSTGKDTAYFVYFTPPTFLGGDVSQFAIWVMNKLQYPDEAKSKNEEGEVKVKFTVDETGKVNGIQITKQDRTYFNSEVLRVISSSPRWNPARKDNQKVDVTIEIPIKFSLTEKAE